MTQRIRLAVAAQIVTEMSGMATPNIPIPSHIDLSRLTEGDTSPLYVTVAVQECVSKNGRRWSGGNIRSIAEQVNTKGPNAYLGHLEESNRGTAFPEPQTRWIGAVVQEIAGKTTAFIKGYVLPTADKLRTWLKTGAVNSVSVAGLAVAEMQMDGTWDIREFDLESIDWSRKDAEGMTAPVVAVTNEMQNNDRGAGRMEGLNVLKTITIAEMNVHNPTLVKAIGEEALRTHRASDDYTKQLRAVSEMTSVRTALGLSETDDLLKAVSEMKGKIDAAEATVVDAYRTEKLATIQEGPVREMATEILKPLKSKADIDAKLTELGTKDWFKSAVSEMTTGSHISTAGDNRQKGGNSKFFRD